MAGTTRIKGNLIVTGALTAGSGGGGQKEIQFVLGADTNLAANNTITVPRLISTATAGTLVKMSGKAGTGPTGANLTVALKKNGSTIATLTILAGATTGNTTTFTGGALVEGDLLTVVVGTVGSSVPGKDLHIVVTVS